MDVEGDEAIMQQMQELIAEARELFETEWKADRECRVHEAREREQMFEEQMR